LSAAATAARSPGRWRLRSMPLGKYRRSRPSVFLVRAALPGAMRVAEVDLDAGADAHLSVAGHLGTLVPCQRPAQLAGQRRDRRGDRVPDRLAPCPGEHGAVRCSGVAPWPCMGGRCSSIVNRVLRSAKGADRRAVQPEDLWSASLTPFCLSCVGPSGRRNHAVDTPDEDGGHCWRRRSDHKNHVSWPLAGLGRISSPRSNAELDGE
jgi:hypothetical protein